MLTLSIVINKNTSLPIVQQQIAKIHIKLKEFK